MMDVRQTRFLRKGAVKLKSRGRGLWWFDFSRLDWFGAANSGKVTYFLATARCFLAASWPWHMRIVLSSERSFSCKRCLTVSPSRRPSMIWSHILFYMQASLRKLQVFTSSLKEMR